MTLSTAPIPSTGVSAKLTAVASALGRTFLETAAVLGGMAVLWGLVLTRTTPPRFDTDEFKRNLYKMSVRSLPIVFVTALLTGTIMVIQAAPNVKRYGAEGLLGWGAGFGTLREIGPLLTALMVSGRVGANNTADLGTMVVTEQIDALRALAIDPIGYLIAPRYLGIVITLFLMTLYSDIIALVAAAYTGDALLGVSPVSFLNGLTSGLLGFGDVAHGLIKSVLFGVVIALASCHFGLSTQGGAPGVGRSVNGAVVTSAVGVLALDYFVSFVLG